MMRTARPIAVIADARHAGQVVELLLDDFGSVAAVVIPDLKRADIPVELRREGRACFGREDVIPPSSWSMQRANAPDETAYIMFTSGSTGRPKGVRVQQGNVLSYLSSAQALLRLEHHDRATQLFDLTFDLSVHDLFVTWAAGACLYAFQDVDLLAPLEMVRRHALTTWFSVPTLAARARRRLQATPGALESLRLSLFCGEALAPELAREWQRAAPRSAIFNLYGPTETTIAVTAFKVGSVHLPDNLATVPIGRPFAGQQAVVLDEDGQVATAGAAGELLIGGSQVTAGYLDDDASTQANFVDGRPWGGAGGRWYRTGDLAKYDDRFGLIFLGRRDLQAKINGYRVELLEVESVLRQAANCELVAAVPWPQHEHGGAGGIVGVLCGSRVTPKEVIRRCASSLPVYMLPRQILSVSEMPLNSSGKIDRDALREMCANSFGENPRLT
jgi:amino acid adenylation domain-containing protein